MTKPWITVIGVGADGLCGLSETTRALIASADALVGGERHQTMIGVTTAERLTWSCGIASAMEQIAAWRGKNVVVLASGEPLYFGAGTTLARHFSANEISVIPFPGAFSLACARMVWSMPDTVMMTVHGRAHETLNLHIQPQANIVALSWNGDSPATLAAILCGQRFGPSKITVFSDMGTEREQRFDGTAEEWSHANIPDLNTVCIECIPGPDAVWWPRTPGLPEEAYVRDSQITKREVRAATLAALSPLRGEILWDVGAGSGSVSIEWMRSTDGTKAVAIERDPDRVANIALNAKALGVPHLEVISGTAPDCLIKLSAPDAVFVGGGVSDRTVLDTCWERLMPGGRLVANAVTLEAQNELNGFGRDHGGSFTRISVARSGAVGRLTAMRPMMDVLQLLVRKPRS